MGLSSSLMFKLFRGTRMSSTTSNIYIPVIIFSLLAEVKSALPAADAECVENLDNLTSRACVVEVTRLVYSSHGVEPREASEIVEDIRRGWSARKSAKQGPMAVALAINAVSIAEMMHATIRPLRKSA